MLIFVDALTFFARPPYTTVEVRPWMRNYVSQKSIDVSIQPYLNLIGSPLVKGAPGNNAEHHRWCQGVQREIQQSPDSKVHGANMGPLWGRQDPEGPHVGLMNIVIWEVTDN